MHFCEGMDGFPSVYTAFCRSGLLTCIHFFWDRLWVFLAPFLERGRSICFAKSELTIHKKYYEIENIKKPGKIEIFPKRTFFQFFIFALIAYIAYI